MTLFTYAFTFPVEAAGLGVTVKDAAGSTVASATLGSTPDASGVLELTESLASGNYVATVTMNTAGIRNRNPATWAIYPDRIEVTGVHAQSSDVPLRAADNLSDLTDPAAARDNLGLSKLFIDLARVLDALIVGTVTRDSNGAATSAPVVWPDGSPGTYTADTLSTAFPGAVDGYHITYGSPVIKTYTQPTITRDASGVVTAVPAIVVS